MGDTIRRETPGRGREPLRDLKTPLGPNPSRSAQPLGIVQCKASQGIPATWCFAFI